MPKPVDYAALAKQYGAVDSTAPSVDYAALAAKFGGTSQPAQVAPQEQPQVSQLAASHEQKPGAIQNFAENFNAGFGIPVEAQRNPSDLYKGPAMAVSHPRLLGESLKQMGTGIVDSQQQLTDRAYTEMHSPGVLTKLNGVANGVLSLVPVVGPVVAKAADQFNQGDVSGGLGTSTALGLQVAGGTPQGRAGIAEGATKAGVVARNTAQSVAKLSPRDVVAKMTAGNQAAVMPGIGKLPARVVNAAENIFRAAAPTNMRKGFRGNLYAAVGDLADIGRTVDLSEAKGGIINPDMRVRATAEAIRGHLKEMYDTERAPQIQRNANSAVNIARNPDSIRGLEYLESTAGMDEIRTLARKAIDGKRLSVPEADVLARAANQELIGYEQMTKEGQMQARTTNPRIGGLKALDTELGSNLNKVLTDNGEVGLRNYERRHAALSDILSQLDSRKNAVELQRQGVGKYIRMVTGGKEAITSASQAAVADVNIGLRLQRAFKELAKSDLTSKTTSPSR